MTENSPIPSNAIAHGATPQASTSDHKTVAPEVVILLLATATLLEIVITVFKMPRPAAVPLLLGLSFVKASLVALYFMHLRYEKFIYGFAFVVPSLMALLLTTILMFGR